MGAVAAMCLLAFEYLAWQQGKPVFQASELRICVGFGGLEWISTNFQGPNSSASSGLIDHLFWVLSNLRNGPPLNLTGLNVPSWSHFSKGKI